jgi:hypothetical protein
VVAFMIEATGNPPFTPARSSDDLLSNCRPSRCYPGLRPAIGSLHRSTGRLTIEGRRHNADNIECSPAIPPSQRRPYPKPSAGVQPLAGCPPAPPHPANGAPFGKASAS